MTTALAVAAILASFVVHLHSGKSSLAYLGSLAVMEAAILSLFVSP